MSTEDLYFLTTKELTDLYLDCVACQIACKNKNIDRILNPYIDAVRAELKKR